MEKDLLIVDGNNQLHRAFHAYKRLSYKGQSTSVLYGMPSLIDDAILDSRVNDVIIVWDGDRSQFRKDLWPEYKSRKSDKLIDREDLNYQKRQVQKLFYYLGVKQVMNKDQEGDDMIFKIMTIAFDKKGFDKVIIMSSDKDFHQLLQDDRVTIRRKEDGYMTTHGKYLQAHYLKEAVGYEPHECVDYLTLIGDKSDNIPGYGGIGPARARKFLDTHISIDKFLDSDFTYPGIKKKKLSRIKKRNRKLIDLELYYNINKEVMRLTFIQDNPNPKFNKEKYIALCEKFGLRQVMGKGFIKRFLQLQKNGRLDRDQKVHLENNGYLQLRKENG